VKLAWQRVTSKKTGCTSYRLHTKRFRIDVTPSPYTPSWWMYEIREQPSGDLVDIAEVGEGPQGYVAAIRAATSSLGAAERNHSPRVCGALHGLQGSPHQNAHGLSRKAAEGALAKLVRMGLRDSRIEQGHDGSWKVISSASSKQKFEAVRREVNSR
jgi:hypothetical protein